MDFRPVSSQGRRMARARAPFAMVAALILTAGAALVWLVFSWLACEAMGTLRPGEYPLCYHAYGTAQHFLYEGILEEGQLRRFTHVPKMTNPHLE